MTYIYDILLNFNESLIEYFEWNSSDKIKYVKKIIVFKVDSKVINDILYNDVLFDESFINKIPKYEMNGVKDAGSLCLLCDGVFTVGLLIRSGKPVMVSRMLLDEEQEVIEIVEGLRNTVVAYRVLGFRRRVNCLLTRRELVIRDILKSEFDKLYVDKDIDKLMYFYYEFTNKECNDIDYIYKYLINSLEFFSVKHIKLFDIFNLSNAKM